MNLEPLPKLTLLSTIALLLPLGLWAMVWMGISGGRIEALFDTQSPVVIINRFRSILPLAGGAVALAMILAKPAFVWPRSYLFIGPLGLTALYGLVGVVAIVYSPDRSVSLYWVGAYLSVPLVLWGVLWGRDELEFLRHLMRLNWFVVISAVLLLFTAALLFMDLGSIITDPTLWFKCPLRASYNGQSWHEMTGFIIRATGVGRYAAIAAVIALSGLMQRRWRGLWAIILLASLTLLLTSGARTAFFGFLVAAALVIVLYGGRKVVVAGAVALLIVAPLIWFTGFHESLLRNCMAHRGGYTPGTSLLRIQGGAPPQAPKEDSPFTPSPTEDSPFTPSPTNEASPTPASRGAPAPTRPPTQKQVSLGASTGSATAEPELKWPTFFYLSGRTPVWIAAWGLFEQSPVLGYGFHGDRLVLGTHMHNAYLHALFQTGVIGIMPFIGALLLGWVLFYRAVRNLPYLPQVHKHLVIQTAGILALFSVRSIPESTGAFYGIDWILLAPLLLYLQLVNQSRTPGNQTA